MQRRLRSRPLLGHLRLGSNANVRLDIDMITREPVVSGCVVIPFHPGGQLGHALSFDSFVQFVHPKFQEAVALAVERLLDLMSGQQQQRPAAQRVLMLADCRQAAEQLQYIPHSPCGLAIDDNGSFLVVLDQCSSWGLPCCLLQQVLCAAPACWQCSSGCG
jgi:hypothetical protein